ncbi:MAG: TraR/DksA family transcriptional regulator [Acidobacteriaceae bacterium]|nr:TraR/DksA family transcriptional regulator [Acidobacteriaceae bacterium]
MPSLVFSAIHTRSQWPLDCDMRSVMYTSSSNYDLNTFKAKLESRIAELKDVLGRRDAIAVEQNPDQGEEIQRASERALEISRLDRESSQLRNARAALLRIQEGTFGICAECEEEIHPKRLAAIPWASLCLVCQEAADQCSKEMSHRQDDDGMDSF